MSYRKAMRHKISTSRKQGNNHFGFSTLAPTQRRKTPWLGSAWFEPGKDEERAAFIKQWQQETARLLKENPYLELI